MLLLTGSFEPFDEARARAARADGHIAKPFDSQSLLNRVRELVEGVTAEPLPLPVSAMTPAPLRPRRPGRPARAAAPDRPAAVPATRPPAPRGARAPGRFPRPA